MPSGKSCCIYGFRTNQLLELAQLLEQALEMKFEERDSLYKGVYYRFETDDEEFSLQSNRDPVSKPDEDQWIEERYKDFPVLLYVDCTQRSDEIHNRLLLRVPDATQLFHQDDVEECR